jgi:hypothetical protein
MEDIIVPTIAKKKNSALFGISTPRGKDDMYTYICNLPDPAREVIDPVTKKVPRPGRTTAHTTRRRNSK